MAKSSFVVRFWRLKGLITYQFLIILFLLLSAGELKATVYYVSSSSGSDSNSGDSESIPWKSLEKVNSFTSKPGDQILFKRGDQWMGTILVKASGSSNNPIKFGAYGTGSNPLITGFSTISGWTNEGGGIYSKIIASESKVNMVAIDGIQYAMGRYPNSTRLTFESYNTNVSITDNELASTPNWTGASVVINKSGSTIDKCIITSHVGKVLYYNSLGTLTSAASSGGYYFIQDDLRTLDQFGEWFHDEKTGKFFMYFGSVVPETKIVEIAMLNNLLRCTNGSDFINISNISFRGSVKDILNFQWQNDNCIITGCQISFAGLNGIFVAGNQVKIDNCSIENCNRIGVMSVISNSIITNNTIRNIATLEGQGNINVYNGGIYQYGDNFQIQNNIIENTAYNGIFVHGNAKTGNIINNTIKNTAILLWDQGSIYLYGDKASVKVDGNIILNSNGSGVFLDEYATNIIVSNNTVFGCSIAGIKLHKSSRNSIQGNKIFNNYKGISIVNWINESNQLYNVIENNEVIAKGTQYTLNYVSMYSNYSSEFSTQKFSNNYYARPVDDTNTINIYFPAKYNLNISLAQWMSLANLDLNSHMSSQSIPSPEYFKFEYNASAVSKSISLDQPMIDVRGVKYSGNLTLQPYTSVVLMNDLSVATLDVIRPVINTFKIPSSAGSFTIPVYDFFASDNKAVTGYILTESAALPSLGDAGWSAVVPNSYTFTSEGPKTLYAWARDAAGNISNSLSAGVQISLPSNGSATMGYTEVYNNIIKWGNQLAMPVKFSEAGEINSISIYHEGGTGNLIMGVYSDQSGVPSSRLGITASTVLNTTAGWQTVSLTSPVAVNSGQTVWLSWVFQTNPGIRYTSGTPGRAASSNNWSSGFPIEFGASTVSPTQYSVYCNYTVGGSITEEKLGYTDVYSNIIKWGNQLAMPVTFNETGQITSISIYHEGGTGNLIMGVYSDESGIPLSRLGITAPTVLNATAGWQTVSLTSPVSVSSGQTLWLSWVFQTNPGIRYTSGTPGRAASSNNWSSGFPPDFGASTIAPTQYSVYCNYTTGGVITTNSLGNTEVYSSIIKWGNQLASPVAFNESGEITSISIYHEGGTGNLIMGVYSDLNGVPSSRLGITKSTVINATPGWQTISLTSPVPVYSGRTVWLSWVFQTSPGIRYTTGIPGRAASSNTWTSGFPIDFGVSTLAKTNYSVYCTYKSSANTLKAASLSDSSVSEFSQFIMSEMRPSIIDDDSFRLYPNPASSFVNIEFAGTSWEEARLTIFDHAGRMILNNMINSSISSINISQLAIGVYYAVLESGQIRLTRKFVVSRN